MKKIKLIMLILVGLLFVFFIWKIATYSYSGSASGEQVDVEVDTNDADDTNDAEDTEDNGEDVAEPDGEAHESAEEFSLFPSDNALETIAENDDFLLKADSETGHFIVEDKKAASEFRSFPNPDVWDEENTNDAWQLHLRSPFMLKYVELNNRKDQVKELNFFNQETDVDFEKIENGFQVTYEMPDLGFIIPIEVRLKEDYVETKLLADDIIDEKEFSKEDADQDPKARLVSFRLFPFLGADNSEDEDGFLFIPDGSGVQVDFEQNRATTQNLYSERIYGDDLAFSTKRNLSSRLPIKMPVFGINSGDNALLGVVHEGDSYTNIVSAPSGSFSQYNWITGEHLFRFKVFQPTNKQKTEGFFTYSNDMQRNERTIRYYMIDGDEPNYVSLAERYRQYLIDEKGIQKKESESGSIALNLNILGGGIKDGFIKDSYLTLTPMDQAQTIVERLEKLGVDDMSITYHGWNKGGYGAYGGHFPVAKELGGKKKMKDFVDFAHSKDYPVYLDASTYTYNNTGKDGFRRSRDGLRDLSSSVVSYGQFMDELTIVSPLFMKDTIDKDIKKMKALDIDGYLFGEGIGSKLYTDYNERYLAERHEVKDLQVNILDNIKEVFEDVRVASGNFYTLETSSHMTMMDSDYSYDIFVNKQIPFSQIALHGLIDYSFDYGNMSGNSNEALLKGIEYGATPTFLVTSSESQKILESQAMRKFYSTYYKDWEEEIASHFKKYNDALSDVQNQFITDHREIANGVFETTYEKGKKIVVNYNSDPYIEDDIEVEAEDFIIIEGGE